MPFFQDVKTCRKQCARQVHTYTPRDGKKREFFFFFLFSLPSRETLEQRERCRNLRIESPFPKRFPLRQFSRGIKSITPALPCKTFPSLCVHIYVCACARACVYVYVSRTRKLLSFYPWLTSVETVGNTGTPSISRNSILDRWKVSWRINIKLYLMMRTVIIRCMKKVTSEFLFVSKNNEICANIYIYIYFLFAIFYDQYINISIFIFILSMIFFSDEDDF